MHIEKDSEGEIYIKFHDAEGAAKAIESLGGRWFASQRIEAGSMPEAIYHLRFPKSQAA
jgi:hypothetical protein